MACLGLLGVCLGLAGCSLFGKKTASAPTGGAAAQARADAAAPAGLTASAGRTAPSSVNGILAGRVLDLSERPKQSTYIRVVLTQEGKGAPIEQEVAADSQGFFNIQGLEPGRNYQLIARAPDGEHLIAGIAYGRPPNPRMVIHMSEDLVTSATPPIPPPPTWPNKEKERAAATEKAVNPAPAAIGRPAAPGSEPGSQTSGVELGVPGGRGPSMGGQSGALPNIPTGPNPNIVAIPGPRVDLPRQDMPAATVSPGDPTVPSCTMRGDHVVDNFALKDMTGRTWDFRRDHQGKLILLDFWGKWCPHCVQAIPTLKSLQSRYASSGLEVIGIDYEDRPLPFADQVRCVNDVERLPAINGFNYRVLLGGGIGSCPVQTKLRVRSYPTIVLLDASGTELWRCEGLDPQLENIIRNRLGLR